MSKADILSPPTPNVGYERPPPPCGTKDTPPCPVRAVLEVRTELIFRIAGRDAPPDQLTAVAEHVDRYLVSMLQSTLALLNANPSTIALR